MNDPTERVFSVVLVGIFLVVVFVLGLFQVQTYINTNALNTIATRQTLQLDQVKSRTDQGHYIERYALRDKGDSEGSENKNMLYNDYQDGSTSNKTDYQHITPDDMFGMPTEGQQFAYGAPYGFSNKQTFTWRTIFGRPTRMTIYEARSGVNRGNFTWDGYSYRGEKSTMNNLQSENERKVTGKLRLKDVH